jgi:hypothetical protein
MSRALVLIAVIGIGSVAVVRAQSGQAVMTVSVNVVRSCAVDARSSGQTASTLRLTCASGANSALRVSEAMRKLVVAARVTEVQVPTVPFSPGASDDLRVVTLNF